MYRVIKNIPLEEYEEGAYFSKEELDEENRFLLLKGAVFQNKVPVIEKYPDYFELIPEEIYREQSQPVEEEEESYAEDSL